jgi:hypothetical protein
MATAEFRAMDVVKKCSAKIEQDAAKLVAVHEKNITDMMNVPYGGFWPFSKPRLRSRQECERSYCMDEDIFHTAKWWAELPFKRRKTRITAIMDLAAASGDGLVTLDEDEASLVGIA